MRSNPRRFAVWCVASVAGGLLAAPILTPAAPQAGAQYAGSFYKRQAIVVSDLDRALTLYRDLLGFELDGNINRSEPTSYVYDVLEVPRTARIRTAPLNGGAVQSRTMLLVEITGVTVPPRTGVRTAAAVINANGRHARIIETVQKWGLTVRAPHVLESPVPGRAAGIERAFHDWDGNVVLLYEFPGGQAPVPRP
jgi:catechol 2,3-dioxygenase-like lactoylglutathione lyase family enzyme